MADINEQWLPVPFDDRYSVSSLGRVRGPLKMLKLMPKRANYLKVAIGGTYYFVHHLVALAFIGPKPEGCMVLHRDDDRTNNCIDNLYYGTASDNAVDRVTNGLWINPIPPILTAIDKHFIKLLHKAGYKRKRLMNMFDCSNSTLTRAINS